MVADVELSAGDDGVVVVGFDGRGADVGEVALLEGFVEFALVGFRGVGAAGVVLEMEDSGEGGEVLEVNGQPVASFSFEVEAEACDRALANINHAGINIKPWTHEFKLQ